MNEENNKVFCSADYCRELKAKNEELQDKHWNECRQIAHYEDELRTYKGWINVEDRLPDDYNICLVWYRYDGIFGVGEGYGLSCYHPDSGWRKTELQGDNISVLYWQQLPEQPLDKSLIG